MRVERFYWPALWALAAAVLATHVLGAGAAHQGPWGADAYGFLPGPALAVACALLAAALLLALAHPPGLDRALRALPGPADRASTPSRVRTAVAMAVGFLAFWWFREGHTLLGDGGPLTHDLPLGLRFHAHEPLTVLAHHGFYRLARGLFGAAGGPVEAARGTVGLSSALAGALFIPVAWGLARELARALPANPAHGDDSTPRSVIGLVFVILMSQGYVQLFFGYVENYTFHALALGVYLLCALRALRGAAPLALPGIALALDVGLDLSAVALAPSFAVLVVQALATPGRRRAALRDLALVGVLVAGLTALMASVHPGYALAAEAGRVVWQAIVGHGSRAESLAYMFSAGHVRDFLSEQMLIGPAAAFLFVAGVIWTGVARTRLAPAGVFLLVAGLACLGGAWVTTDLGLGYARDWDLFAPSAIVLAAAGLHVPLSAAWRGPSLRRWLFVLACLSVFHTAAWVGVNTSFERSFERFKTLPLGLGRTEAVVGAHYLAVGDTAQAIAWFQRSLDANAANNTAAYLLGEIGMQRGMYRWAAHAFQSALQSRPDKEIYRFALADAIVRGGGRPQWALPHLDTLVTSHPAEPAYWAAYGVVWLGVGERARATSAFERAARLAPADSTIRDLLRHAGDAGGYARAVRDDWPAITAR